VELSFDAEACDGLLTEPFFNITKNMFFCLKRKRIKIPQKRKSFANIV